MKPIGHGAWRTICELGLSTRGPTTRGCRGGTRKERTIKIVVGNRPTSGFQHRTICQANLMSLPRRPHQCFSSIPLDFCLLNIRGSNKGDEIVEFVTDNDLDILAMTETWLKPEHDIARGDMTTAGYTLYEEPRPGEKRGGGVAVLCLKKAKRFKANTFESMNALITSGTKSVRLVVVYRPQSKKDQNATAFLAEFGALLETLALDSANVNKSSADKPFP